jgi:hypothetical protein
MLSAWAALLGDCASKTSPRGAFVIGGDDLPQILRVEAGGERRRADEIAEHHRDLPAFGRGCGTADR